MKVNIKNLDLVDLLKALYDGAIYGAKKFDNQPTIRKHATTGLISSPYVKQILAIQFVKEKNDSLDYPKFKFGVIDLGAGPRDLAIDLSEFEVDTTQYNELHGKNAAEKIIAKLKGQPFLPTKPQTQTKESKNIFYKAYMESTPWLKPKLMEVKFISKNDREETQNFFENISKILSDSKAYNRYEKKPNQSLYLSWLTLLDPTINTATKIILCEKLNERYVEDQKNETYQLKLGGTLSELPLVVKAPLLVHSPKKTLLSYMEYQHEYRHYHHKDENFVSILKFIIANTLFSKEVITQFISHLIDVMQQQKLLLATSIDNYYVFEAFAAWERESLITSLTPYFDDAVIALYEKFKINLQKEMEETHRRELRSEIDALVFENFIVKHEKNAEALTPIVMSFSSDDEILKLKEIYAKYQLNFEDMMEKHLIELAKMTQDSGLYTYSSLFFCHGLKCLKDTGKTLGPQIAAYISPRYFAKNAYAFDGISKAMYDHWIKHMPDQMLAVVEAILDLPDSFNDTPINHFFFHLSYDKMPDSFYDRLAELTVTKLIYHHFFKFYMAADEKFQIKLLKVLCTQEKRTLEILQALKKLQDLDQLPRYSLTLPRTIYAQLKLENPDLYKKAIAQRLFVETSGDLFNEDLILLKKIFEEKGLTNHQRRTQINELENISDALYDKKIDTCPVIIRIFEAIPQEFWPALFHHYNTQINHWSFPWDDDHLKLFSEDKKPEPRKNTWLSNVAQWENILSGTLQAVLQKKEDDAYWTLSALDEAFTKSHTYFPGLADRILKAFFLKNMPESIKVFEEFYKKFNDKYHQPTYFRKQGIFDQLAAWLPEDVAERVVILVALAKFGFEKALRFPFVRSEDELALTAMRVINERDEHAVNLFQKLSGDINYLIFKSLYRIQRVEFIEFLQSNYLDIINLPMPDYLNNARMLLSYSQQVGIDIFEIIDVDPHKSVFLKTISNFDAWQQVNHFYLPYPLIFKILNHYQPELLPEVVMSHVQRYIEKNDMWRLCGCMEAALAVTSNQLEMNSMNKTILIEFLSKEMSGKIANLSFSEIKIMSHFIPNFDKVYMTMIAKDVQDLTKLSYQHKECLDSLIQIYGFNHLKSLCLAFKLKDCVKYITEKFSDSSFIVDQINAGKKAYRQIFDNFYYMFDDYVERNFYDKLQSQALQIARKTQDESFKVDVTQICMQLGISEDIAKLFPSLTIKKVSMDIDLSDTETCKEKKAENITALVVASRQKTGLIKSPTKQKSAEAAENMDISSDKLSCRHRG